uniref:Uncharacterized protein n=1 Tax=Anopheles atroparvus TaxID=41427 RepID=A0AAG5DQD0_ANOAO
MELEELLSIIYSISTDDFFEIVTEVPFEYCQKKGCYYKTKAFMKNLQSFHAKHLERIVDADEYCFSVCHRIVNTLLEQYFGSNEVVKNTTCKLFLFLQPWVKKMSNDTKKKLSREIR